MKVHGTVSFPSKRVDAYESAGLISTFYGTYFSSQCISWSLKALD